MRSGVGGGGGGVGGGGGGGCGRWTYVQGDFVLSWTQAQHVAFRLEGYDAGVGIVHERCLATTLGPVHVEGDLPLVRRVPGEDRGPALHERVVPRDMAQLGQKRARGLDWGMDTAGQLERMSSLPMETADVSCISKCTLCYGS